MIWGTIMSCVTRAIAVGVCATMLSQAAFAFDMTGADASFNQRENNRPAIAAARAGYRQALQGGSAEERRYAAGRIGRLAYFEGDLMTPEKDDGARKQIFGDCLNDIESINPAKIGQSIEYYYWKAVCIAFWAKAAGKLAAVGKIGALKEALTKAEELDKTRDKSYEGGGIYRLLAGIYIGSKFMSLFGLYDPEAALAKVNKALALCPSHYNAYVIKADVLETLGQKSAALSVLEDARRDLRESIAKNKLPVGYEPEARLMLPIINARLRG